MKGWLLTWQLGGGLSEPWKTAAALSPTVPGCPALQHGRLRAPAHLCAEPAALLQQVIQAST